MPRGDLYHSKTVIRLTPGYLDVWETVKDQLPEGATWIIGELMTPRGRPKPLGLKIDALRQRRG